jgi:hypothetical protein
LAHVERLQPALQEPLINKAEREWPQRLERISAERKAQKQESKAVVRAFVQVALVDAPRTPPPHPSPD